MTREICAECSDFRDIYYTLGIKFKGKTKKDDDKFHSGLYDLLRKYAENYDVFIEEGNQVEI